MEFLNSILGFRVELWAFVALNFAIGLVVSYGLSHLFVALIGRYLTRLEGMDFLGDSFEKAHFSRPLILVFLGWAWLLGFALLSIHLPQLPMIAIGAKALSYIGITSVIWQSADLVRGILIQAVAKKSAKVDALLAPLITRIVRIVAIVFGALSLAEILHLPIASLLTGLGLGGFAIAMAAKETLSNLFGSMAILTDRPFQIGDWVKVGEVEGYVEEFGLRSTRIRTFYDSIVMIPNSTLLTVPVDNMRVRNYRRFKTTLNLAMVTTPEQLAQFCEQVKSFTLTIPTIREDAHVFVSEMLPATGIVIQLVVFFKVKDNAEEAVQKHALLTGIHALANTLSITWFNPK